MTTGESPDAAEVVERAIRALGALDFGELRRWVADDLVLELPFRAGGLPTTLTGERAHRFIRLLGTLLDRLDFRDVVVHGQAPSGVIAAEYRSDGRTKAGLPYPNVYAAFFEVRDGKVIRWREYFNPDVVAAALPRP